MGRKPMQTNELNDRVKPTTGKRLLNIREAAGYLGLSPRTLYNRCAPKSVIPFPVRAKRIGKALRFDLRDLDAYIDTLG